MTIAQYIATTVEMTNGELRVWVPDDVDAVRLDQLDQDVFNHPERPPRLRISEVNRNVFDLFDRHLGPERGAVIATDTFHGLDRGVRPRGASLSWFSCDSPHEKLIRPVCCYIEGPRPSHAAYNELLGEASPYPTTVILTSLVGGLTLRSGDHLTAETMRALVRNTEHILLGVFDEISFLLWSRSPEAGVIESAPR